MAARGRCYGHEVKLLCSDVKQGRQKIQDVTGKKRASNVDSCWAEGIHHDSTVVGTGAQEAMTRSCIGIAKECSPQIVRPSA